jgi:hypothetical protein
LVVIKGNPKCAIKEAFAKEHQHRSVLGGGRIAKFHHHGVMVIHHKRTVLDLHSINEPGVIRRRFVVSGLFHFVRRIGVGTHATT